MPIQVSIGWAYSPTSLHAMKNILYDEKKTVKIMIKLYCNKKHGTKDGLCEDCEGLLEYAYKRLDGCKFGNNKGEKR